MGANTKFALGKVVSAGSMGNIWKEIRRRLQPNWEDQEKLKFMLNKHVKYMLEPARHTLTYVGETHMKTMQITGDVTLKLPTQNNSILIYIHKQNINTHKNILLEDFF